MSSAVSRPVSQIDTPLKELSTVHSALSDQDGQKRLSQFLPDKHDQEAEEPMTAESDIAQEVQQNLGPIALTLLMLGICLAAFLVALDRTIIATAIPRITDEFDSPGDVGWYGSAYLLTSCAFQPTYGRVFAQFNVRWAFCIALALFELGSLVCGVAPSSNALIVGRAIAGLGCAGIFAGCLVIIAIVVPLRKRPIFMGLVGSIFGVGSVCGPIIGGALTSSVTWRWCFYINLPVGAVTFITLLLFFNPKSQPGSSRIFLQKIMALDLVGNFLLVTAVTMLLLALQWGGLNYAWNSAHIIGLLIGAGLETVLFFWWESYRGANALVPLRMIRQRTIASSLSTSFFISGATLVHAYYLSYWFQVVRDDSPTKAGVNTIPYFVGNFCFAMLAGLFVTKFGYYNPPALLGPVIASIGSGLITSFNLHTKTAAWAGYEILAAGGVGLCIQQGIVAVQTVLTPDMLPIGTSLIMFSQSLAGAVFVSVGSSLLRNELAKGLEKANLPGVNVTAILNAGATDFRGLVPESALEATLTIYNSALSKVFIVAIPLCCLALLTAIPMEWRHLEGPSEGRAVE
ncbi:MAG: hypothetical protein Q9191_003569 [Dirinaria sp. TL-2023a]